MSKEWEWEGLYFHWYFVVALFGDYVKGMGMGRFILSLVVCCGPVW